MPSRKLLLPTLSLLALVPLLALVLAPRLDAGGALAGQPGFAEGPSSPWPPPGPGDNLFPYPPHLGGGPPLAGPADTGDLELEVVGRWPYGPAYAVAAGDVDGAPYAFLGSGGGIYVVDVTDPATPTKVAELATRGMVKGLFLSGDLLGG